LDDESVFFSAELDGFSGVLGEELSPVPSFEDVEVRLALEEERLSVL
jgi:hypothetical protein